MRKITKKKEY